ncbi:MAG TPA: hypothetical protein DEH78_30320, partial [Solibacterales bacterium]|nr:hypothetical protein [Bryobacterales bacterium]
MKWAAQAVRHNLPSWLEGSPADAREAERLLESGNFAQAEQTLLQVVAALKSRSVGARRHAKILLALAQSQVRQGKNAEARRAGEAALELFEGPREKPCSELAVGLDLVAGLVRSEEPAKATEHLRKALEIERKIRPRNIGLIIERIRNLASILLETEQPQEARDLHREALKIARDEFGEDHATTAGCLIDLGKALSSCGEHKPARESVEEAIEIYRGLAGSGSEEVAVALQVMGAIFRAEGDLEKAINCYERALSLRERQLGSNAAELGVLLMSLAGANSDMGRFGPAVELMQQAVGRLEGAKDHRLAPALENLGNVYVLCGRFEDAVSCLQRARHIWQREPDRYASELDLNAGLISNLAGYFDPDRANALLRSLQPETAESQASLFVDDPGHENARVSPLTSDAPADRIPDQPFEFALGRSVPLDYARILGGPPPPSSSDAPASPFAVFGIPPLAGPASGVPSPPPTPPGSALIAAPVLPPAPAGDGLEPAPAPAPA